MDKYIGKLQKHESESVIRVMAFASYNPSIGRVLEKGGVKKFQDMAASRVGRLKRITTLKGFDRFHMDWVLEIIENIRTNRGKQCRYGQAQKPINTFLKFYVDWAKLPDEDTANRILPFLHVPLDSILMTKVAERYHNYYKNKIKPIQRKPFAISKIDEDIYLTWQKFFRDKSPEKPLLFDIIWAMNR